MPVHLRVILVFIVLAAPIRAFTGQEPYTQKFVITAYYSPIEGQCCYVKGGLKADKILNGEGVRAADGTAVYPGMIAAPPSYPFGTKVSLPGIGTFTVHDRGGAITELEDGAHRLDIWIGHGEEALARALDVGLLSVEGTVYPLGSDQPATAFDFETFDAPLERLLHYQLEGTSLLDVSPRVDDISLSTKMLQTALRELGYFQYSVTGKFGVITQEALTRFIQDFHIQQPSELLTKETAATLMAAVERKGVGNPIRADVNESASQATVMEAQRILRFLGYYRGRTDGKYTDALAESILKFQQEHWLVGNWGDPGAGVIGPVTMKHLRAKWDRTLVAARAERLLLLQDVKDSLTHKNSVETFLTEGNYGPQVEFLQTMLADRGFFPAEVINGSYGPLTKESVLAFQLERGIVKNSNEKGAGSVGPTTLSILRNEEMLTLYRQVRSEGLRVL